MTASLSQAVAGSSAQPAAVVASSSTWHASSTTASPSSGIAGNNSLSAAPPLTGRGKSFVKSEQLLLCKCFLAISEDPIIGRYQKGSTFYGKIADAFNAEVVSLGEPERKRGVDSITAHWRDTIQKKVSKFCGCYDKAKAVTRSGWSEENYVDEALTIYMDSCGNAFKLLHCWEFLRDKPKWRGVSLPVQAREVVNHRHVLMPLRPEAFASGGRPIDNKKAKHVAREHEKSAKAKLDLAASIAQSIKTKNDLLRDQNDMMKDQIAIQIFSQDRSTEAQDFLSMKRERFLLAARRKLIEERTALALAEARLREATLITDDERAYNNSRMGVEVSDFADEDATRNPQ